MSKYCPHCREEIDHLGYDADYTEWGRENGTCGLDGEDWEENERDSNDSENDNAEYYCPLCSHQIDDFDDLLNDPDDDDDCDDEDEYSCSIPQPISEVAAIDSLTDGGSSIINRSVSSGRTNGPILNSSMSRTIICSHCETLNFTEGDNTIICLKCNNEIIIN